MKNLEMWVGILELNDQGSYVPAPIEERKDVKTGGVYMLRQVFSNLVTLGYTCTDITIIGSVTSYSSDGQSSCRIRGESPSVFTHYINSNWQCVCAPSY